MYAKPTIWAEVDEDGRLVLPDEVAKKFGHKPGARLRVDLGENDLRLHRPITHLAKVYLEPTNRCNLECRTCMRNAWEVEMGQMSQATFNRVLDGLRATNPPPAVTFMGLGEPLAHPRTIEMVAAVKETGAHVELITNGTLLNEQRSRDLIASGLDVLWVSIDGAHPESYDDVRLGAALPDVLANMMRFRTLRGWGHMPKPEIGIVFVAMRRNIADLPEVLAIGRTLRATRFLVTNLMPYTSDMCAETLYNRTLSDVTYLPSPWLRKLSLPKMDIDETTGQVFLQALRSNYNVNFAGFNLGSTNDVCTFIENGAMAIGWDGSISQCPPLLYTHTGFVHGKKRTSSRHILGNVNENDLLDIWNDPEYEAYRDRVSRFAFAPCTFCGGCELIHDNQTDCFGNPSPECGGCLWAQGVIRCP